MAECIVCKGEYTPGQVCPRCGADNTLWENWQQEHPEEQGGPGGLRAFMRPHLYLPLILTVYAFGCSLLGLGGIWTGVRPGFQLLAVILTVCGCLLVTYANYEARHSIREQMLLAPLRRGWLAALHIPRNQAIIIPALTILFAFAPVYGRQPPGRCCSEGSGRHIRVHRKLERGVRIMPLIMEKSVFVRVHPRSSASYFR